MQSISRQCCVVMIIAAAAVPVFAPPACAQSAVLTAKGQQIDLVLDELRAAGRANVIVEFSVPDIDIESDAGLAAHKSNVRTTQDAIITQKLGRRDGVSRMAISPMFAVRATLAELERLAADSHVLKIYPNKLNRPTLIQSVPLIRGHILRGRGGDGRGNIVAIIDTGVKRTHEFLKNKVLIGACFSNGGVDGPASTCPNGEAEQIGAGAGEPCSTDADCIHGTHVAGIAAGDNSDHNVGEPRFGVAPRGSLIAINVASNVGGQIQSFDSDITKGLDFVFDKRNGFGGKKVAAVNISLGTNVPHTDNCDDIAAQTFIIQKLQKAGIATVIASGNNGFRNAVSSPGCIAAAVTVGASNKRDRIADISNMGPLVDLMAPGVSILSSVRSDNYAFFTGTSMAAPHVAGAFAALRTLHPRASVKDITQALKETGKPIEDDRTGGTLTRRRINVDKAEEALPGGRSAPAAIASPSVISVEPATVE